MKILVCNSAYIGDIILSTAILPPLKKKFPDCQIGFLTQSSSKSVVENHKLIDFVHIHDSIRLNRTCLPKRLKKVIERQTKRKAIEEMRKVGYDIAIDLHSYSHDNSSYLIKEARITDRVGYGNCAQVFFYNEWIYWNCYFSHVLENHKAVLQQLNFEDEHLDHFKSCLDYKDEIKKPSHLPSKYFCVHPHAGWPDKEWHIASWQNLLQKMQKWEIPFVIIGKGKNDMKRTQSIMSVLKNAINMCDQLSLRETMEVVKDSQFLIGMDSMAGHLAAHYGKPALLLYNGRGDIGDWRPYHPYCHIIKPDPKYWHCLKEIAPKRPIDMIPVDDVLNKAEKILTAHRLI